MQELFDNLSVLLHDICSFLQKEVINAQRNDGAAKIATELIKRSMTQILDITNTRKDNQNYLSMDIKRGSEMDEYVDSDAKPIKDDTEHYSNADELEAEAEAETETHEDVIDAIECPYKNSKLTEIETVKEGYLSRKESLLFIFKRPQKYYVVMCEDWFMFYNENKRGKPFETYCLDNCNAIPQNDCDNVFELHINERSFIMIANTRKEAKQWISVINNRNTLLDSSQSLKLETQRDEIQFCREDDNNISAECEPVYEDVVDVKRTIDLQFPPRQNQEMPTLPPPRQPNEYINTCVQSANEDIYDVVQAPQQTDEIYDLLAEAEEDIYDLYTGRPESDKSSEPVDGLKEDDPIQPPIEPSTPTPTKKTRLSFTFRGKRQ